MVVDGKRFAEEILAGFSGALSGARLGIVLNEGNRATESFVKIKERAAKRLGVQTARLMLTGDYHDTQAAFADLIRMSDGVLIQLPHPHADELIAQLPPEKDVDALRQDALVEAPVAGAVREILLRTHVRLTKSNKVVVVGEGRLVGKPVAQMLRTQGYDVSVVSLRQGSLASLKDADVVVSGAGSPGLIKPTMLKPGVVLIDAGASEQGGRVVGDADPACAEIASVYTPVPGGVGPIAVAMLFKNLATLVNRT